MIDKNLFLTAISRARQEHREPVKWQLNERAWCALLGDVEMHHWIDYASKTLIGLPVEILPYKEENWNLVQLVTDRDRKKVAHGKTGRPISAKAEFSMARATFDVADRFEYKQLEDILVELPT